MGIGLHQQLVYFEWLVQPPSIQTYHIMRTFIFLTRWNRWCWPWAGGISCLNFFLCRLPSPHGLDIVVVIIIINKWCNGSFQGLYTATTLFRKLCLQIRSQKGYSGQKDCVRWYNSDVIFSNMLCKFNVVSTIRSIRVMNHIH